MRRVLVLILLIALVLVNGCASSARKNVIAYLVAEQFGTANLPASTAPPGAVEGFVTLEGAPVAGVTVVVAERTGTPYAAISNGEGYYKIVGIPPGQYVPGAVAPGLDEMEPLGSLGIPWLVTVRSNKVTEAPLLKLQRHLPPPLPVPLARSVQLSITRQYTSATHFPVGSQADVTAFQFVFAGVMVDSLRLYLPRHLDEQLEPEAQLPLLFMVYPTAVDLWVSVSTAYAAQGYALVAISPMAARELDVDAHAQDARIALALAQSGALSPHIRSDAAIALGGSFSSAILNRLLRDTNNGNGVRELAAWVTVGGIGNAFTGAADFYAGRIQVPPEYRLLIPALGPANLYPLPFLRYSPVFVAGQLPPTLIIHTAADTIIPIEQAKELEAKLRAANVPTEVFFYQDVSHYLQIGDDMTTAGQEMFWRILDFIKRYTARTDA